METLQHAVLGHVGEAEQLVGGGVVELGRVEQAAIQRRYDFGPRQRVDRGTELLVDVDGEADGAELDPLHVVRLGHRLLEPAERLRRHRAVEEGLDVEVQALVDLVEQGLAAAIVVPGQHHVGVHAESRAGAPQRDRAVLAVPVGDDAVAAIQRSLADRVEQLEGLDHRAGRQHLDLQLAAGHLVDLLGEVQRVFVEDVLGRPGRLPAHGDRRLGDGDHREAGHRRAARARRGGGEELAPRVLCRRLLFVCLDIFFHVCLLEWSSNEVELPQLFRRLAATGASCLIPFSAAASTGSAAPAPDPAARGSSPPDAVRCSGS